MNVVHLAKINKINHVGINKMKINHVISESELDEFTIPFTKQARREKQVSKDIKADISDITGDLKAWMKGSQLKNVTIDQFKNFLNQKGLDPATIANIANDRTAGRTGVEPDAPLTSAEVKQYIEKAVRSGFLATGPGATKSRFAAKPAPSGNPPASGQGAPDITNFVNSLTPQQKAQLKAAL
jgi:hypothetical protein